MKSNHTIEKAIEESSGLILLTLTKEGKAGCVGINLDHIEATCLLRIMLHTVVKMAEDLGSPMPREMIISQLIKAITVKLEGRDIADYMSIVESGDIK